MRRAAFALAFLGAAASSSEARAFKVLEEEDRHTALNIGILLQPWFQVTEAGSAGRGPCGSATHTGCSAGVGNVDGDGPGMEFFLRRVRLMVWGRASEELAFVFDTDEANLGRGGNFAPSAIVQDAFFTYSFAPGLRVDVGLMLLPITHHVLEAASGLNTLDYHAETIRFPVSLASRDVGVELRGLLGGDRVHYRAGIFEGVRAGAVPVAGDTAASPRARPALNDRSLPRIAGQVRLNLLGSEPDFLFKGIYFSATPLVSIGVSGDFQHHAVYTDLRTGARGNYSALSGDVFAELPFDADDELIAKASASHYGRGTSTIASGSALIDGGVAGYAEAGFRHGFVEPVAFIEYVRERRGALTVIAPHAGVNVWIDRYEFNLKTDFGYRRAERHGEATQRDLLWTAQAQLLF